VILVDTSVWIDHFRHGDASLVAALEAGDVLTHPAVIGELALGGLTRRQEVLRLLGDLPGCTVATHDEALIVIERYGLAGSGIGYVDVGLVASTLLTPNARLWTRDTRLAVVAERLSIGFPPS
jgi:hypothetical protein